MVDMNYVIDRNPVSDDNNNDNVNNGGSQRQKEHVQQQQQQQMSIGETGLPNNNHVINVGNFVGGGSNSNSSNGNRDGTCLVPDYINEAFELGMKFRKAMEADTLETMDVISNPSLATNLEYYAVPAKWFHKAWRVLSVHNPKDLQVEDSWRQDIGRICNAVLLDESDTINDNDDDNNNNSDSRMSGNWNIDGGNNRIEQVLQARKLKINQMALQQKRKADKRPRKMKPQFVHPTDYVFLGKKAWDLAKAKFGYDGYDIRRTCVQVPMEHRRQVPTEYAPIAISLDVTSSTATSTFHGMDDSIATTTTTTSLSSAATVEAVAKSQGKIDLDRLVFIPATGRFPYESMGKEESIDDEVKSPFQMSKVETDFSTSSLLPFDTTTTTPMPTTSWQQQQQQDDYCYNGQSNEKDDEDQFSAGNVRIVASKDHDSITGSPLNEPQSTAIICLPNSNSSHPSPTLLSGDSMDIDSSTKGAESISARSSVASVSERRFSGRKRHSSGLGNLGNTCFMNATLQCLAYTDPIRRYFLSGEFKSDLNKDNPLGTKGQLAEEFANLMCEMWGKPSKKRNVMGYHSSTYTYNSPYSSYSSTVYPRAFKTCLGRHAAQFMGYAQHDSQELATYLLDALHEDTNRVINKPYVEKPEQGEDESDEDAAKKAWELYLSRDDSSVSEFVMGQEKSRLECCEDTCTRVSTTFDPLLFLSVPIPGSNDKTIEVTFVPLDSSKGNKTLRLTVPKTSAFGDLHTKLNEELMKCGIISKPVSKNDLVFVENFQGKVWKRFGERDGIGNIPARDTISIYELMPYNMNGSGNELEENEEGDEMQWQNTQPGNASTDMSDTSESESQHGANSIKTKPKHARLKLDLATLTKLSKDWQDRMESFDQYGTLHSSRMFNRNRTEIEECKKFLSNLEAFIERCYEEISKAENNEPVAESTHTKEPLLDLRKPSDETVQELVKCSEESEHFRNVTSTLDLAVLDHCSKKFAAWIYNDRQEPTKPDPIEVEVRVKVSKQFMSEQYLGERPIILRLPGNLTVYSLRQELANRLSPYFKSSTRDAQDNAEPSASREEETTILDILLQATLSVKPKNEYYSYSGSFPRPLYMIRPNSDAKVAIADDPDERKTIANVIGQNGFLELTWEHEDANLMFDKTRYSAEYDDLHHPMDGSGCDDPSNNNEVDDGKITLYQCIRKYCQKEQLEESEMWYCSKCKKHVKAWKQVHLFRTPPILIIHLKRFSYIAQSYSHRRDKITNLVDFPLEGLDLTEFVPTYSEDQKPIYDCYAVTNHFGSLGGGHYTAYTLGEDGQWIYYDDSRVDENRDKSEVVSEAAYVLYYRRRDVQVGLCEDEVVVDPRASSPMVVDETDVDNVLPSNDDLSSNGAQAGDLDRTMDTVSNTSSKTEGAGSQEPSINGPMLFEDNEDSEIPAGILVPSSAKQLAPQ